MERQLDEFIQYMITIKRSSKSTQQCYRNDLEKLRKYFLNKKIELIEEVTATDLTSFILYIEKQGLSNATITRNVVVIKKFFEFLQKKGYRKDNPSEYLKPPKVEKKETMILSIEEMKRLFSIPIEGKKNGARDKGILMLFYETGIYINELMDLKKEDINISLGYLRCCREKKDRVLSFHKKIGECLKQYDEIERVKLEKEDKAFFLTKSGHAFSRQGIWKILKKYGEKAKISAEITPFLLRSSYEVHRLFYQDVLEHILNDDMLEDK